MFTLAHISDVHLAPLPDVALRDLVGKRITGYINWQRKRRHIHRPDVLARVVGDMLSQTPDHIAVTGDIVNLGLPEEFPPARAFLESLGSAKDVSFVPGNHDMYVREAAAYLERLLGPQMADDSGLGGFPYVRRRGPVALIGLSSAVATAPFLATGWLGAKQLSELAAILNELKNEGLFRVVMIHHPPQTQSSRSKQLLDTLVLRNVIGMHGVDMMIHGHDHRFMHNTLWTKNEMSWTALGVPSASAAPGRDHDNAGYNLYRIDGEPGAWRCEIISRALNENGEMVEIDRKSLGA